MDGQAWCHVSVSTTPASLCCRTICVVSDVCMRVCQEWKGNIHPYFGKYHLELSFMHSIQKNYLHPSRCLSLFVAAYPGYNTQPTSITWLARLLRSWCGWCCHLLTVCSILHKSCQSKPLGSTRVWFVLIETLCLCTTETCQDDLTVSLWTRSWTVQIHSLRHSYSRKFVCPPH